MARRVVLIAHVQMSLMIHTTVGLRSVILATRTVVRMMIVKVITPVICPGVVVVSKSGTGVANSLRKGVCYDIKLHLLASGTVRCYVRITYGCPTHQE